MNKKKPKTDWGKSVVWKDTDGTVDAKRIYTPPEIKFLDYKSENK